MKNRNISTRGMNRQQPEQVPSQKRKPESPTELLKDMQVLKLGPGDVIVLKSAITLRDKAIKLILESMKTLFPDNHCVILEEGLEIGVISKAKDEPGTIVNHNS